MAICNLFKTITKETGNFIVFSQYTEDLTKSATAPSFYRVIPSKFIAIDGNYYKNSLLKYDNNLNKAFPLFLLNDFENGCAILRSKLDELDDDSIFKNINNTTNHWSSNIFWNTIFNIINPEDIRYIGDINIQSYNEYDGMGYSEIYCFIPNSAFRQYYKLNISGLETIITPDPNRKFVEGYIEELPTSTNWTVKLNDKYNKLPIYNYGNQYNVSLIPHDKELFKFNTIIILYDVKIKDKSDNIITYKENIPMGIYLTGTINEDGNVNNSHIKYVNNTDIYDSGTSYGLRICSRFTTTPESDSILNIDIKTENASYSAFCLVMSSFGDSLAKMNEILNQFYNLKLDYNELYAIFKNSRTNVPYIKDVGDKKYWFVNGRMVSEVCCGTGGAGEKIDSLTNEEIDDYCNS